MSKHDTTLNSRMELEAAELTHWATEECAMLQHVERETRTQPSDPSVESEKVKEAFALMKLKALTATAIRPLKLQSPPANRLVPSH